MQKKLYFGHPINTYGTDFERDLLHVIACCFPEWEIENPNQLKHRVGCERARAATGNPMDYFTEEVLPSCQGGIFLPFRDFAWDARVFVEAEFYAERNLPIWKINPDKSIFTFDIKGVQPLTVAETIARIRTPERLTIHY